jgi:hypothetical protein
MQINRRQRGQKKGLIRVPAHKLYFPRIQADHQGSLLSTQGKSTSKAEARALGRRTIFLKKYIFILLQNTKQAGCWVTAPSK